MKMHFNLPKLKNNYTIRELLSKYNEHDKMMRYISLYIYELTVYNEICQLFSVITYCIGGCNMKQVLFSNEVMLEDDRVMKLDYCLTERISEADQTPYYGVMITKFLNELVETEEITGVSASREDAVTIIKKLCQFEVTPISMVEIVDELVAQGC